MAKDNERIALIVGAEKKHSGSIESEASWSIPGIISCTLAGVLGVLIFTVPKLIRGMAVNPRSPGMIVFWASVVFGLGAGAGLGLAGLIRVRSSKLSPALGFLFNVGLFAVLIWAIVALLPMMGRVRGVITAPSVTSPQ